MPRVEGHPGKSSFTVAANRLPPAGGRAASATFARGNLVDPRVLDLIANGLLLTLHLCGDRAGHKRLKAQTALRASASDWLRASLLAGSIEDGFVLEPCSNLHMHKVLLKRPHNKLQQ